MPSLDRRSFLQSSSLLFLAGGVNWTGSNWVWAGEDAAAPQFAKEPAFQPQALFLTWQQDPTTTMTVQWVGSEADGTNRPLWHRQKDIGVWQQQPFIARPLALSKLLAYRTELTDLKADTEYEFHVGLDAARERFRTMPAKDTGNIEFISGGDSGTGSASERSNRLAAQRSPRFVVMGEIWRMKTARAPKSS